MDLNANNESRKFRNCGFGMSTMNHENLETVNLECQQ
jgi:hypothetical protein